jgi:hypothetical protein
MDALPVLNCWVTFTLFLTSSQKVPGRAGEALACALGSSSWCSSTFVVHAQVGSTKLSRVRFSVFYIRRGMHERSGIEQSRLRTY